MPIQHLSRWVLAVLVSILIVSMVALLHGTAHHRGTTQVDDDAVANSVAPLFGIP
jgi:hypothetical protein